MKKVDWKTLKVTLKAGENLANKNIDLDSGERIVVAAAYAGDKSKIVDLELQENGQTVSAGMDLDFWKRSNAGHYLDGFKPIEYKGGTTITGILTAPSALAADLPVEVVFGIIKGDTTC